MTKEKYKVQLAIGTADELEKIKNEYPKMNILPFDNVAVINKIGLIISIALLYNHYNGSLSYMDLLSIDTDYIKVKFTSFN